ncbi:MAG: hypothetical protein LBP79_06525 [Clostridiales bacterium]|jgi:YegS/Rv2252/BmrU family lipid kinase|nr:hypothetical protein [Clostridiales bacterium]
MNCLIINNPVSGHSKTEKEIRHIKALLEKKYETVDIITTSDTLNAADISRDSLGKYHTYVILGGDGTFGETMSGLAGKPNRPVIGYIPSGTINDIARAHKIPFNYKKAVEVILTGKTVARSSMFCNGVPVGFLIASGIFTSVPYTTKQAVKRKIGKLAYYIDIIFRDKGRRGEDLRVSFDGEEHKGRFIFAAAVNNSHVGGLRLTNVPFDNDGSFYIVLVKRDEGSLGLIAALATMVGTFLKKIENAGETKRVVVKKTAAVKIKSLSDTVWNTDGEKGPAGDVEITYAQDQFELIVPN